MTYRAAAFTIDNEDVYPGLTDGTDWNGFACPLFAREVIERQIADSPGVPLVYDARADAFVYDGEEIFEGEDVDGTTYYAVGAGSWVWCEIPLSDVRVSDVGDDAAWPILTLDRE